MNDFKFNEATHTYSLDGEILPSVTRILSPLNDFAGIKPEVLQHSADRGTAIHYAIELLINNDLDEDSICDEIKPYLSAFKKFRTEKQPQFISSEQRLYHPELKYAGTMDLFLKIKDYYFVDIKNTYALSKTAGIQLAAYQEMSKRCPLVSGFVNADSEKAERATLWLKRNGTYQLVTHKKETYQKDWQLFQLLLNKVHTDNSVKRAVEQWKKENEK